MTTNLDAEQLQRTIDQLTTSIDEDRATINKIQEQVLKDVLIRQDLEEKLNTIKYAHLDFKDVPWGELLTVDDCGNTNKQLKLHINNMMEGKMAFNCSSYNIHTLQSVPQVYINKQDVTPHYKELMVRVIDTLLPHIIPQNPGRVKIFDNAKYFRIVDPSCGEFGTHYLAYTDKWHILSNGRETGNEFQTTTELVNWITQYLAHGDE